MRTQVVIVGSGPSGLLLGQLLAGQGIETVILDRVSKDYILGRVRAGVLEQGTVQLMRKVGADGRLRREGLPHDGFSLTFDGRDHRATPLMSPTGKTAQATGSIAISSPVVTDFME